MIDIGPFLLAKIPYLYAPAKFLGGKFFRNALSKMLIFNEIQIVKMRVFHLADNQVVTRIQIYTADLQGINHHPQQTSFVITSWCALRKVNITQGIKTPYSSVV